MRRSEGWRAWVGSVAKGFSRPTWGEMTMRMPRGSQNQGLFLTGLLLALVGAATLAGQTATTPPPPLTAEQQARLKDRDRYAAEAKKRWEAGQHAEAVAAWEKKLALEREVLGPRHPEVADSLKQLAHL